MRPIDADALVEILAEMQAVCNSHEEAVAISKVWQQIKHLPTIEPKKGHWIDDCACSECGWCHEVEAGFVGSTEGWNFCPNCGADMKGEEDG